MSIYSILSPVRSTKIFFYDGSFIEIEDYGIIKSKKDYIEYMDKIKLSKIKSARKWKFKIIKILFFIYT